MPPISIASQHLSPLNVVEPESAVDIDGFLHLGHKKANPFSFSRGFRSQFLPRLNKSQHTILPFDIDHLVTLGKHTLNQRSENHPPSLEAVTCENFALGLLPNESMDSLSSEDTTATEADGLPSTPLESSLYPITPAPTLSTNNQIMDIDHLIQIGSSSVLSASNPALSYRTLGADQNINQAVTTEERRSKSGIVKANIEAPPMLSSRHTFPLTRHSSLYPLDIDYFIQIGNPCGARPATEKAETSTKSTQLAARERTSPSSAFTRHTKLHLWGKCVSKLKKLFFA